MIIKEVPQPQKLWKNQRLIDEFGLVVCQQRQRLFDNIQSATLFQSLLKIYQSKGLRIHYMYMGMDGDYGKRRNYETIKYKAYVRFRCTNKQFDGGRKVIDYFYINYEIIRLSQAYQNKFKNPFFLLFRPACGQRICEECNQSHFYKIFQSSLYVIRSQFIYTIKAKINFMEKYPIYNFQPFDFTEKRNSGQVIYQFIKDHNYQPSYYIEKSEEIICNTIRMHALRRSKDFEVIRFDHYKEMVGNSQREINFCQQHFDRHKSAFKLKYMCRKCQPKQIWTTKNECINKIAVLKLRSLVQGKEKVIYDKSNEIKKQLQRNYLSQQKIEYGQILESMLNINKSKIANRRFDRSLKKQVEEYEDYSIKLNTISRWHQTLEQYRYPYIVIVSLEIPKMKCQQCQKEKEGLIYITNILEELHAFIARRVIDKIDKMMESKDKQT